MPISIKLLDIVVKFTDFVSIIAFISMILLISQETEGFYWIIHGWGFESPLRSRHFLSQKR